MADIIAQIDDITTEPSVRLSNQTASQRLSSCTTSASSLVSDNNFRMQTNANQKSSSTEEADNTNGRSRPANLTLTRRPDKTLPGEEPPPQSGTGGEHASNSSAQCTRSQGPVSKIDPTQLNNSVTETAASFPPLDTSSTSSAPRRFDTQSNTSSDSSGKKIESQFAQPDPTGPSTTVAGQTHSSTHIRQVTSETSVAVIVGSGDRNQSPISRRSPKTPPRSPPWALRSHHESPTRLGQGFGLRKPSHGSPGGSSSEKHPVNSLDDERDAFVFADDVDDDVTTMTSLLSLDPSLGRLVGGANVIDMTSALLYEHRNANKNYTDKEATNRSINVANYAASVASVTAHMTNLSVFSVGRAATSDQQESASAVFRDALGKSTVPDSAADEFKLPSWVEDIFTNSRIEYAMPDTEAASGVNDRPRDTDSQTSNNSKNSWCSDNSRPSSALGQTEDTNMPSAVRSRPSGIKLVPTSTDWSPINDLSPIMDVSPSMENLDQNEENDQKRRANQDTPSSLGAESVIRKISMHNSGANIVSVEASLKSKLTIQPVTCEAVAMTMLASGNNELSSLTEIKLDVIVSNFNIIAERNQVIALQAASDTGDTPLGVCMSRDLRLATVTSQTTDCASGTTESSSTAHNFIAVANKQIVSDDKIAPGLPTMKDTCQSVPQSQLRMLQQETGFVTPSLKSTESFVTKESMTKGTNIEKCSEQVCYVNIYRLLLQFKSTR